MGVRPDAALHHVKENGTVAANGGNGSGVVLSGVLGRKLRANPMNILCGYLRGNEKLLACHAVVALRVSGGDMALVDPENMNPAPVQIVYRKKPEHGSGTVPPRDRESSDIGARKSLSQLIAEKLRAGD